MQDNPNRSLMHNMYFLVMCSLLALTGCNCGDAVVNTLTGCEDCPNRCVMMSKTEGKCVECVRDSQCSSTSPVCLKNQCVTCRPQQTQRCTPTGLACKAGEQTCDYNGNWGKCICGDCEVGQTRACQPNGQDVCQMGQQQCDQDRLWTKCQGFIPKVPETCDSIDNDCDGQIDNGLDQECYLGPPDTRGIGNCALGKRQCINGQWGACVGSALPTKEECDGEDDDCNGKIDDLPARDCYTGPAGTQGTGNCKGGQRTCNNGTWSKCQGEQTPTKEDCNGLDDDCNGQIDENLTHSCYDGPAGTDGKGTCQSGTKSCNQGKWTTCQNQVIPTQEVCGNNLDDDCNGQIDDPAACHCKGTTIGGTEACYGLSCQDIKTRHPNSKNGAYWVKPANSALAFQVYCDMTTDKGGWMLAFIKNSISVSNVHLACSTNLNLNQLKTKPEDASNATQPSLAWMNLNQLNYSVMRIAAYAFGRRNFLSSSIAKSSLRIKFGQDGYLLYKSPNGYYWCIGHKRYTDLGQGQINQPPNAPNNCKNHQSLGSGWDFSKRNGYNQGLTICGADGEGWMNSKWQSGGKGTKLVGGAQAIWVR